MSPLVSRHHPGLQGRFWDVCLILRVESHLFLSCLWKNAFALPKNIINMRPIHISLTLQLFMWRVQWRRLLSGKQFCFSFVFFSCWSQIRKKKKHLKHQNSVRDRPPPAAGAPWLMCPYNSLIKRRKRRCRLWLSQRERNLPRPTVTEQNIISSTSLPLITCVR